MREHGKGSRPAEPVTAGERVRLPIQPRPDTSWMASANCAGVDLTLMFPGRGGGRAAKAVCHRCSVRQQCLDWALDNGEHFGVWGGTSEAERKLLRRARRGVA